MSRTVPVEGERTTRPTEFVQSLERGLAVLRAFSADQPAMTLSEVARTTRLTRATARRLLLTFEALGYMRSDGRHFELTPRVLDLGYAYLSSVPIWRAVSLVARRKFVRSILRMRRAGPSRN